MARPPRHNVDYFPHYISDGKKMFIIESKYGNDGYAVWFKLLESLAKTDDHWMDLSDPANMMYLCAKCRVSNDIMESIINDLANLGEVDAELWRDERVIWSQKFIDSIEEAYKKRSNVCPKRETVITKLRGLGRCKPPKGQIEGDVNPHTKVNHTKPKETKKEKGVPPPPTIDEVIAYFKEKGYTEASARKAFDYYQASVTETKRHWSDGKDQPIRNWKMKMQSVWFKDENRQANNADSRGLRTVTLEDGTVRTYANISL
jgi:hypothetical protein